MCAFLHRDPQPRNLLPCPRHLSVCVCRLHCNPACVFSLIPRHPSPCAALPICDHGPSPLPRLFLLLSYFTVSSTVPPASVALWLGQPLLSHAVEPHTAYHYAPADIETFTLQVLLSFLAAYWAPRWLEVGIQSELSIFFLIQILYTAHVFTGYMPAQCHCTYMPECRRASLSPLLFRPDGDENGDRDPGTYHQRDAGLPHPSLAEHCRCMRH